jgi:Protein of unknown function (DUF2735)
MRLHESNAQRHKEAMMNTNLNHGSAKIYQFPAGGRAGKHRLDEIKTAADLASSQVSKAPCGSGWYHEAAIEESKPGREH